MRLRVRLLAVGAGLGAVTALVGAVPADAAAKKRADLIVRSVSVSPTHVGPGGLLKVKDTTRNRGRKAAPGSVTRYVLSKDRRLDRRDVRLHDRIVKRLKPRRAHASKVRQVRIPSTIEPGTYWVLACADARRKVRESNERNNCRAARSRLRVAATATRPKDGVLKVDVSARIDVAWRYHSGSAGFDTRETEDVRLEGKGSGLLYVKNGKPQFVQWNWSSATASGTEVYAAQGQTNDPCPWEADARISGSSAIDVRPHGMPTGGIVLFPDDPQGPKAHFGLSHEIRSQVTPRINCRGENIGNVSPVPTVELRQYWWAKEPTYTIGWSPDLSTVTWREHGENDYVSPNGGSFEDKSYQADGVLTLTPAT